MVKHIILVLAMIPCIMHAQDLVILHTNDLHSHLNGLSPEMEYTPFVDDNDPTLGGFARIAGFIKQQQTDHADKLLVLDAGDFLMGTFFQTIEPEQGFQLGLMKKMGYDFMTIGNHEFDNGPEMLAQIINVSKKNGEIPQLIQSNYKPKTDQSDHSFLQLFDDGTISTYKIVEKNGYRIGLFALMGDDAKESVPTHHPVEFNKPAKVARSMARYLKRNEKVDLVIAISHSGIYQRKNGSWHGEDFELALNNSDIDLIISGHSHTILNEPVATGNTLIVQTGSAGANVGRVEVRFTSERKPLFDSQLHAMNDKILACKETQTLIDQKAAFIEEKMLKSFGVKYNQAILETNFTLNENRHHPTESNLGPFVADALHYYLNEKAGHRVDIAFIASGVIRNNIEKGNTGKQNINDIYNVVPLGFGNDSVPGTPLGVIYVTAHELKNVMELIMAVYPSKPHYYLYFSGMRITMNPDKRLFKKISKIEILQPEGSYKTISTHKSDTQLYAIAANHYMLGFIGGLKKMSKGIVNVVPKNKDGEAINSEDYLIDIDPVKTGIQEGKEWMALFDFVRKFEDTTGNGIPNIPEQYRNAKNPIIFEQ